MSNQDEGDSCDGSQATPGPSHQPEIGDLQCPLCLKVFKYEAWFNRHIITHPASCIQEQTRLARNAPSGPVAPNAEVCNQLLHVRLAKYRTSCYLPDHIPKSTRRQVAQALVSRLQSVVDRNDVASWTSLLMFSFDVLGQSRSAPEKRKMSLPKIIRRNLRGDGEDPSKWPVDTSRQNHSSRVDEATVQRRSGRKFNDGDVSGVVKLLLNEETLMPSSPETLAALAAKHPKGKPVTSPLPTSSSPLPAPLMPEEIQEAVDSFPNGSAAGSDGLRPQYLKELLGNLRGVDRDNLCRSLAAVGDLMLSGAVPDILLPVIYGANLFAFKKKDGGVRPIAVGTALRRLVARVVARRLRHLGDRLRPTQLGFATPGGAEAAAHAARSFVETSLEMPTAKVFMKLDVKNAFNSIDRTALLECVRRETPEYYRFAWQNYGAKTLLLTGDEVVNSEMGVQQGDPLGPVWYCLVTAPFHRGLKSELVESFLDDDALGGNPETVMSDFRAIAKGCMEVGLELSVSKCELFVLGGTEDERNQIYDDFLEHYPSLQCPHLSKLVYLGTPLTDAAVPTVLEKHTAIVGRLAKRLELLPSHQALYLLAKCFGHIKLLYILRTSRCYRHLGLLRKFDSTIRESIQQITNTALDESSALQASLPIGRSGLGIRRSEELAPTAFLASAHSVHQLISSMLDFDVERYTEDALDQWIELSHSDTPPADQMGQQKAWDAPVVDASLDQLYALTSAEPTSRARLKALCCKESGAWLRALPAASLGNLLDNGTLRLAVAVRLGAKVGEAHRCVCGERADVLGHHALSCKLSAGRQRRHKGFNEILSRALVTADQLTELEPLGLSDINGKRPDGITITPWLRGKRIFWDATCTSTVGISNIAATTLNAGAAARNAEVRKTGKYQHLLQNYLFAPVAIETMGPWGPETRSFLEQVGQKIAHTTGDPRAMDFLRQRFSIELQRGNAACILGTAPVSANLDEIFGVVRPRKIRVGGS